LCCLSLPIVPWPKRALPVHSPASLLQQLETVTISNELLRDNYRTLQAELARLNEVGGQLRKRFADETQSMKATLAAATEEKT